MIIYTSKILAKENLEKNYSNRKQLYFILVISIGDVFFVRHANDDRNIQFSAQKHVTFMYDPT